VLSPFELFGGGRVEGDYFYTHTADPSAMLAAVISVFFSLTVSDFKIWMLCVAVNP